MTRTQRRKHARGSWSFKRMLISALALPAAVAMCVSVASPAGATPYTYSFASGSTTQLDVDYSLSGGLTADINPFPTSYTNFSITLTAVGAPGLYAGTYTESSSVCSAQAGFDCAYGYLGGNAAGDILIIEVADPPGFNGVPTLPLAIAEIVDPTSPQYPGSAFQDNNPNAVLTTPLTAVPEPASLAVLGCALGLLGLGRRTVRNRRNLPVG